jgi:thermosome
MSVAEPQGQNMPLFLLKEGTEETKGSQAQRNNIAAAKTIAEVVRTSFGPRGMDKMLVSGIGDVTISNDGATILKEIDIQHPAAKMMVEISKATDNEVGDGTTSAVVFAGALLEHAEQLIAKDVHPTVIVDGYALAAEKAIDILRKASTEVDPMDRQLLTKVALTSMASKLASSDSHQLSKIVVEAMLTVAERVYGGAADKAVLKVDAESIKVEKKAGGSMRDTKLIKGIVLDKEVVHAGMPKRVENARIALLNCPLEIEKTEMSAEIRISDPQQMQRFLEEENKMLKDMVDKIVASGANVVLCQKGIDDVAQHYLANSNMLAARRIGESDMNNLAKATGGRVLTNIDELSASDLGSASLVEERKVEIDRWIFVEGCKNPKAVSILMRGGSQRVVDEAERSVHDAIMAVKDVVEYPMVMVGAGAPEAFMAQKIREWSNTLSGRMQLAVERFADSIESVAIILAENAGMDPIDTQTQLRAKAATEKPRYGVDVFNGKVADMAAKDVYEPLKVKEQVINAATEAACMILHIDDVISASKPRAASQSGAG